jgi:hypothetical protein
VSVKLEGIGASGRVSNAGQISHNLYYQAQRIAPTHSAGYITFGPMQSQIQTAHNLSSVDLYLTTLLRNPEPVFLLHSQTRCTKEPLRKTPTFNLVTTSFSVF